MRKASPALTYSLVGRTVVLTTCFSIQTPAQGNKARQHPTSAERAEASESEMRASIERYASIAAACSVLIQSLPRRRASNGFRKFYSDWLASLLKVDFRLNESGSQDRLHPFQKPSRVRGTPTRYPGKAIRRDSASVPFAKQLWILEGLGVGWSRWISAKVAATLTSLRKQVDDRQRR